MNDTDEQDEQTRSPARALAALTVVALVVAVAVLLIDQQIKRDIIQQALNARRLLDEARALAERVTGENGPRAGDSPVSDSSRGDAPDPVARGARVAAETGSDDRRPPRRAANSTAAPRRRARRDDSGTPGGT